MGSVLDLTTVIPNIEKEISTVGALFDVSYATTTVQSNTNLYQNCLIGKDGGIYYLQEASLNDANSVYTNISAVSGGIAYCYGCYSLVITDSVITNIYSYDGSIFYTSNNYLLTPTIAISVQITNAIVNNL